jgi:hypothetical protein
MFDEHPFAERRLVEHDDDSSKRRRNTGEPFRRTSPSNQSGEPDGRTSWESHEMSATITFDPTSRAPRVTVRPVSDEMYRRRRAVVGTILAVVVACATVVTHDVLAGSGGVPASAAASRPALVRRTVTAQPGDTLWSIAEAHRGDVAVGRFVDKLVDLNGGPSIEAGQQVVLP